MESINQDEWPRLLQENHIVVAMFYEMDDADCNKMEKILDREFYPGLVQFDDTVLVKVPVANNAELANELGIETTPTLLMFHHGEEVKHLIPEEDPKDPKIGRILKPFRGMGQQLLDLVLDLHDIAKQ